MQISLRTLLGLMLVFGSLPFWFEHFLIPFAIILIVSLVMALRGFSDTSDDDINFS